jgi:hypothetical protein
LEKLQATHYGLIYNETKYMTTSDAANEAVWLRKFVIKLGVYPSMRDPVTIICDSTCAIANAKEPRSHSTAKHLLWRHHVRREYVKQGDIKICKVHTDLNVADPLIKPLPQANHDQHRESMGVRSLPNIN